MARSFSRSPAPKVGYVVKRYPRYSETFIVNEVLAHEAAGLELEIFSLYPPNDTHFQNAIARVRSPLTYVCSAGVRAADLWTALAATGAALPEAWPRLAAGRDEDAAVVYQAAVIARLARERGIGHLHAHFATAATSVARLAAHLAGITYSFTAHAKDIFHSSVSERDLERKLADAAAVVTVSEFNLAWLHERFGAAAAKVRRIYNGLDLDAFPFADPARRSPRIVSVGRLIEKKGLDDLVAACAVLAAGGVPFECDIVGAGPLAGALADRITAAGVGERVRLRGPLPHSDVIPLVQSAAVFAGPYVVGEDGNRDGLPTVLVEAMALGTPVVATPVTGVPELVEHARTGLLVAEHDPAALARALATLLHDPPLRTRLAAAARARVERDFDIRGTTPRLRALFRGALHPTAALEVAS